VPRAALSLIVLSFLLLSLVSREAAASRDLEGRVVRVVDGDTIHVRLGSRVEKVRYIGIDSPEVTIRPGEKNLEGARHPR
jgi:endonuclease YncB( thermonuclease family)